MRKFDPPTPHFCIFPCFNSYMFPYKNIFRPGCTSRAERIQKCNESLRKHIETMNNIRLTTLADHLNAAVTNYIANVRWRFLDRKGPQLGAVTKEEPLMFG